MEFQYAGPRMRGAETIFQQWSITPLSSNQYWNPNQVVKFMGNIGEGLIDFYRSHLEFEIQVTNQMMPVGLIQFDSSAQSLISQIVVQSGQQQVERIQQYDCLAALLTDVGFSEFVCQSRSGQGLGYSNIPTNIQQVATTSIPFTQALGMGWNKGTLSNQEYSIQSTTANTFSPVLCPQYGSNGWVGQATNNGVPYQPFTNQVLAKSAGGNWQTFGNWLTFPYDEGECQVYTANTGRAMAVRSEYLLGPLNNGYPDSPDSLNMTSPSVLNQDWNYSNMLAKGYSPNRPYQTTYKKQHAFNMNADAPTPITPCGTTGYVKPIAPQYATGCNQPFLSPTIPQIQMVQGKILPQPIPMSRKTFRVPLLSAVMGMFIPPDQFQLLPAASFKNIILQITLNPYAFFTSGYSDVHEFDEIGMQPSNMQKRNWKINNFQWIWHMYTFKSSELQTQINQKLYKGITISSNYWELCAQYQLPNGSYVRSNWQVPSNVDSLAQLVCIFISNEYQTKTFCRKQFRLSNNITSMQIKANGNYFPLQPIIGNAGNPQTIDSSGDNWAFYEPLLLSNNFLFNTNVPFPRINQKNFAINSRIYDTSINTPFLNKFLYKPPVPNGPTGFGTAISYLNTIDNSRGFVNPHTALGQSWWHQNRYRGTAAFFYSFQPYGHSKEFITGLNTRGYRQFDIVFNSSPTNVYPHDQTMLLFTRSNVVVTYNQNGIDVLGV